MGNIASGGVGKFRSYTGPKTGMAKIKRAAKKKRRKKKK
tara:strand:+ start:79 stop:195 length:117 start_codon:yes stop_codon:yes gene_type:complete